jgi:dihydrofolate reductase
MANEAAKIVAIEHLSLDGVYQAPARGDEDTRHHFTQGGWAIAGNHPGMQELIGRYMAGGWSLLAGRTTYEDLFEGWAVRQPSSPMTQALANIQKFVVSHNPHYPLPWTHSTLLADDPVNAIARLKKEHGKTLVIFGSGVLVRSLMKQGLIDEFLLMIHPLVLGSGHRFFDEAAACSLTLKEATVTGTGVVLAIYQPAGA